MSPTNPDPFSPSQRALLPSNALPSERALSLAADFGEDLLPEDLKDLWRPERAASRFLPFLAWGMHVDFWRDDWPEQVKRRLIAGSFEWHRKKGTVWAVKKVLEDLGLKPGIVEWFEIGTRPHTFGVEARWPGDPAEAWSFLGPDTEKTLLDAVEIAKPTRSHLLYLVVVPDDDGGAHWCVYSHCNYSHGYLNSVKIDCGVVPWTAAGCGVRDAGRSVHRTDRAVLSASFAWSVSRYSDGVMTLPLALDMYTGMCVHADREDVPDAHVWHRRRVWGCGGSWAHACRLPILVECREYSQSTAVFSHTDYSGLPCLAPRFRRVDSMGVWSGSVWSHQGVEPPGWEPLYELTSGVTSVHLEADRPDRPAALGSIVVTAPAVPLTADIKAEIDSLWTLPWRNFWHTDRDWNGGTWLRSGEAGG